MAETVINNCVCCSGGGEIDCLGDCPDTFSLSVAGGTATLTRGTDCQWTGSVSGSACYVAPFDNNATLNISGNTGTLLVGPDEYELDPFDCAGSNVMPQTLDVLGCNTGNTATVAP